MYYISYIILIMILIIGIKELIRINKIRYRVIKIPYRKFIKQINDINFYTKKVYYKYKIYDNKKEQYL